MEKPTQESVLDQLRGQLKVGPIKESLLKTGTCESECGREEGSNAKRKEKYPTGGVRLVLKG